MTAGVSTASPLVLLAAGGTGGHINPAVALAEALTRLAPPELNLRIQFVCGMRPTEWQVYRRQKIEPWVLPIGAQRSGSTAKLRSLRAQVMAFMRVRKLLAREAAVGCPVRVAVGFGSYVSVAPLLAAELAGARLILHEQNVDRGLANRLMTPLADLIATSDPPRPGRKIKLKFRHTGNPVRADFLKNAALPNARAVGRTYFRLSSSRPVCFVSGGSQGAIGVNQLVLDLLARSRNLSDRAARWQILWATGPGHYEHIIRQVRLMGVDETEHSINPYIDEMALAYAAADLTVGRAGALTLAELTVMGIPSVLVPLPTSAHGHQLANARALKRAGAARILKEREPGSPEKLEKWLIEWDKEPEKLMEMASASRALGRPQAADDLALLVLQLIY